MSDWLVLMSYLRQTDLNNEVNNSEIIMFYSRGLCCILDTFFFNYLTGSFEYRGTVYVVVKYL